jgi:hypothetical protein
MGDGTEYNNKDFIYYENKNKMTGKVNKIDPKVLMDFSRMQD